MIFGVFEPVLIVLHIEIADDGLGPLVFVPDFAGLLHYIVEVVLVIVLEDLGMSVFWDQSATCGVLFRKHLLWRAKTGSFWCKFSE